MTWIDAGEVDILDSITLKQLQTLESPQSIPMKLGNPIFSPDSHILTCFSGNYMGSSVDYLGQGVFVVSWDLQTGGVTGVIRLWWPTLKTGEFLHITHLANGKAVGVSYHNHQEKVFNISIYNIATGELIHSHSLNNTIPLSNHIWTHGESLQFATVNATAITIWEVGFTSGATPTEVETLPALGKFDNKCHVALLPTPCRLALIPRNLGQVQVWDVQNSRYLLEFTSVKLWPSMSFSSDGCYFACSTDGPDIYLWKESPAGYLLHQVLTSHDVFSTPLFSQNGELVAAFCGCTIQLWHTKHFPTSTSNILTQAPQHSREFILEVSPNGMLAVVAVRKGSTVTVLDLKSGVPQMTINASMKVYGLGVIGETVVVIGNWEVITWDLPVGGCVPGVQIGLEDSLWRTELKGAHCQFVAGASISPDSHYIALSDGGFLRIYSASTGEYLRGVHEGGYTPWFSPDGCHVWCVDYNPRATVWRFRRGEKVLEDLKPGVGIEHPPEGYPWASSCGYQVTNDWWILGPEGERLLLLPPAWQSYPLFRVWKGQFLALLHGGQPEPVILELGVNCDL